MSEYIRLGLTGLPGTGKTTCANYLATLGYSLFEGSTCLRQIAARDYGITLQKRVEYNLFHQQMQQEHGADWIGQQFMKVKADKAVQIGMRAMPNVLLLQLDGGKLVATECPEEVAFLRMDRTDPKNPRTIEEYREHCALDEIPGPLGFSVQSVINMADYRVNTVPPEGIVNRQLDLIDALMRTV